MGDFIGNAAMQLPVFLFAIVVHEWGHAWMAKFYGDNTAELSGRLTLNPMAHIDPMGTIFFPLLLFNFGLSCFWLGQTRPGSRSKFARSQAGCFLGEFCRPWNEPYHWDFFGATHGDSYLFFIDS